MSRPARLRIIGATDNPDKLARFRQLVGPGADLLTLPFGVMVDEPSPEDAAAGTDEPLVAIAAAKAVAASRALGRALTIATDGGLVIPALGHGWQPAATRRFAGPAATNRQRATALLALAADLAGADRRIVWREAVAVVRDGRVVLTAVAESGPAMLTTDLGEWGDHGQGFWVPRLWRHDPDPARLASTGDEHWDRLALLVTPFIRGFTG